MFTKHGQPSEIAARWDENLITFVDLKYGLSNSSPKEAMYVIYYKTYTFQFSTWLLTINLRKCFIFQVLTAIGLPGD